MKPASPEIVSALRDLARERPVSVTVRGVCMAPWIADGDRVEVAPARLYWPGDVIVFRAPDDRWLVHRLLGWRWWRGGLAGVTRGDGCPCHDAPVPLSRVLGRVVGPGGGLTSGPAPGSTPAERLRAAAGFLRLGLRSTLRRLGR